MRVRLPNQFTFGTKSTLCILAGLLWVIIFSAAGVQPAGSQGIQIEFGETKIENRFPEGIRFSVKIDIDDHRGTVYFHYRPGNDFWTYGTPNCSAKTTNNGLYVEYYSCTFFLHLENVPPQLPMSYKWQLHGSVDRSTEEVALIYEDPNFDWQSAADGNIMVWWHDRPQEFGDVVLSTAKTAMQNQQSLFGVELDDEIQLVVQNSVEEYYVWHEEGGYSVGGQAFPTFGTTVQIVESEMTEDWMKYWLDEVVPHEISHLYFFQASARDHGEPPNWLNEGMAGYNEFGDHGYDWSLVRTAVRQGSLIPLSKLRDEFEGDDQQVSLAYAESTTAVIYMIETYSETGLNKLFAAYKEGKMSDEAFQAAFGRSVGEFETDWEAWVKEEQSKRDLLLTQIMIGSLVLALGCSCVPVFVIVGLILYFNRPTQPKSVL